MHSNNEHFNSLIRLLLPKELFDYFEIMQISVEDKSINIYLDELAVKPDEFGKEKLTSNGFHSPCVVQDFPLRGKALFLHVRRRRWLVDSTGKVVSRDWATVAKGTRFTKEFALFLNKLFR
jgi:hypothetical protein